MGTSLTDDRMTGLGTSSPGGGRSPYNDEMNAAEGEAGGEGRVRRGRAPRGADALGMGPLLDLPRRRAAKLLWKKWRAQDERVRAHAERWRANQARMEGIPGVQLNPVEKRPGEYKCYIPPGGVAMPPVMNRLPRLARRMIATLLVDHPVPEAVPASGFDDDPDKAEAATRILQEVGGEAGIDDIDGITEAGLVACVYGSGFRYYWVDPQGGGHRPRTVMAHPAAETLADAEIDPATGEEAVKFVEKFVLEDDRLADEPAGAQLEWLPKLRAKVCDGRQVRPIPASARTISECEGIMYATYLTFSELRAMAPQWAERLSRDPERAKKLIQAAPERPSDFLPEGQRAPKDDDLDWEGLQRADGSVRIPGDVLVFCLCGWYVIGPEYPMGAAIVVAGDEASPEVVTRGPWQTGDGARRELPFDQQKQLSDWSRDFYGLGLCDLLGATGELGHAIVMFLLDHMEKHQNQKTFVPMSSNLTERQMTEPTASVLYYTGRELPKSQEIPDFPVAVEKMYERVVADMDDESALGGPAAHGQSDPNVQSGLHQQQVMEAVSQALSTVKKNMAKAIKRGWRVQLQEVREGYTTEQEISWLGEDKEYIQLAFHGSDLASTKDFTIAQSSFTGLTPSAKMAMAEHAATLIDPSTGRPLMTGMELRRAWASNMGGLLGVQDNPHEARVKGQIRRWEKGPPEEITQAVKEAEAAQGSRGLAPSPLDTLPTDMGVDPGLDPMAAEGSVDPLASGEAVPGMRAGPAALDPGVSGGASPLPSQDPSAGLPPGGEEPIVDPMAAPEAAVPGAPPPAMAPPPNPLDPMVLAQRFRAEIFDRRPVDLDPEVAAIRYEHLKLAQSRRRYAHFPVWWQAVMDAEFLEMQMYALYGGPQPAAPGAPGTSGAVEEPGGGGAESGLNPAGGAPPTAVTGSAAPATAVTQ